MKPFAEPLWLRVVALFLCTAVIVSCMGCSKFTETEGGTVSEQKEVEFVAYAAPLTEDDIGNENGMFYAISRVLLTANADATYEEIENLISDYKGDIVGYISFTNDYQVRFENKDTYQEIEQLVAELRMHELVEAASLEYLAPLATSSVNYTGDPWINADKPSDESGSVWDENDPRGNNWWAEAIEMPSVWGMDLDLEPVKVGIIDSMFDTTNEDLDENVFVKTWNNPSDDKGDCIVTQLYLESLRHAEEAKKSKDKDEIEKATKVVERCYHGTHVAGIIAAQGDNGFGITGINQQARLYGYSHSSYLDTDTQFLDFTSIFKDKCALAYLFNEGVKVVNISMGFDDALEGAQDGAASWTQFVTDNAASLEAFLLKYIEAGK